jgi:hypothetical protein
MTEEKLYNHLNFINNYVMNSTVEINESLLLENLSDLTYYNLRQFVTLLHHSSNDNIFKKLLLELFKILAILEIKNKPIPTIQKLKNISPSIFT